MRGALFCLLPVLDSESCPQPPAPWSLKPTAWTKRDILAPCPMVRAPCAVRRVSISPRRAPRIDYRAPWFKDPRPGSGAKNRRNPPKITIRAPWGVVALASALFLKNNPSKNATS